MADLALIPIPDGFLGKPFQTVTEIPLGDDVVAKPITLERASISDAEIGIFASATAEPQSISRAMQVRDAIAGEGLGVAIDAAVYVVGIRGRNVCKIGVAANPTRRIWDLQRGSADKLEVFSLVWALNGGAYSLEALCLKVAKKLGLRLHGEWVSLDASSATTLVATVASSMETAFADSAMWLRNRVRIANAKAMVVSGLETEAATIVKTLSKRPQKPNFYY